MRNRINSGVGATHPLQPPKVDTQLASLEYETVFMTGYYRSGLAGAALISCQS